MTFTITGIDGALTVIACLAFLIAAIVAWFTTPRAHWATLIATGLLLWALTALVR